MSHTQTTTLPPPLALRASGPLACFTRPEFKAERMSYPCITPSAARGLLEAVLWKPHHTSVRSQSFQECCDDAHGRVFGRLRARRDLLLEERGSRRNLDRGTFAVGVKAQCVLGLVHEREGKVSACAPRLTWDLFVLSDTLGLEGLPFLVRFALVEIEAMVRNLNQSPCLG